MTPPIDLITTFEGLDTSHLTELNLMSAISEQQIRARYYQSVTADKLPPQFADYQRRDGLLIPISSVLGRIESFQLKPNEPRIGKNGKPIKYETAANAPQVLDVPMSVRKHLGNPAMPLAITEGAKKVDSALSNGIDCVIGLQGVYGWRGTNEHGGKMALSDWEEIALNDRLVLIAFDSDVMAKESVRHALDRLSNFLRGKGARVKYIVMPDLPDGGKCGIDDWFALGKNRDELSALAVDELPSLVQNDATPSTPVNCAASSLADGVPRLNIRYMRDVREREIDWIWPSWLPKGMLTLLGGNAGDGKSTLTTALAAALSTGGTLPDGSAAPLIKTLMVTTEDDVETVVKPRLKVHGMDVDNVITLDSVPTSDGGTRSFNIRTDVPLLRVEVEAHKIGLVVIDPLSSVMSSSDRNNEGEVRDAMGPLLKMAEETGCAVLGIMHIGKTDGQVKAFQKLMGSTAYTALARAVWIVSDMPPDYQVEGEPVRKMIGVAKSNYAVATMPLQYCRPLDGPLQWLGGSPLGIDEVFSRLKKGEGSDRGVSETDKAEEWLVEFMNGKRVLASEVESAAKEEGFGISTMKKAKLRIGLQSERKDGKWFWLPKQEVSVA